MRFFTLRKTKHKNYKVVKSKSVNGHKIYLVKFKEYITGWRTFDKEVNIHYSKELHFETKETAFTFIETEIAKAYKKL